MKTRQDKEQRSTSNGKPPMTTAKEPLGRAVLEAELECLRGQRANALADLQRIAGAEQMAQHLLAKVAQSEAQAKFDSQRQAALPPKRVRK